ncbi:glycoside hydrolase family 43 protein [Botryobacter ruber]|uniref:glycoside hydrolase family 43 protein n=1 Tax=Botryobacter ruber TaxID=2171629 RepID=UPI000E0C2DB5|nr:glycoside hydrolase family 43 protein [Botryobacter ruber]
MIKQFSLLLLSLVLLASCSSTTSDSNADNTGVAVEGAESKEVYMFTSFHEPADEGLRLLYSYDGYKWDSVGGVFLKPNAGEGKLMRDPSMVQGPDGTYHLVWTTAWRGDKGFGYASSKDLINWSDQKFVEVMAHEPETVNVWAPELFYDEENERYIIIWASTIPNRFERGVEDEKNNHRMYYTTTKDFNTFTETKLFSDPGFSIIDAVIVKREKDDYVLVLKDNTRPNRNLKVAYGDTPLGPWKNVSEPFTGNFVEGPTVLKLGDEYHIYYDVYEKKIYGASKTKDFKTFTDVTDQMSFPVGHKHGTIFKSNEKVLEGVKKHAAQQQATKSNAQ